MKVFIGGSIVIRYLDYAVKNELDKYMNGASEILIGDAYGIDSLVQRYLEEHDYNNVTVYASNGRTRNNIGGWKIEKIEVPSGIFGRDFYTYKDVAMTNDCDIALMIWNGQSKGTLANIKRLLDCGKGVGVYLTLLIIFSIVFIALTIVLVVLYMKWILTSIRLRREPNNNAELSTNSDATESNKSINNEQSGDIMPNVECDSASTIIKKFTLKVHDIDLTEIDNPEIEDLKKAVSVLIKTIETFLVLECNVPVNTFTFIQATGFEDGKCHVEAQYKEGEILRMYGFDDMTETGLFDILRDFLLEKVPDISGWNHIGDY